MRNRLVPRLLRRRARGDRGSFTIELSVLLPLSLAVILLGVQMIFWFHGRQVALTAAQQGVNAGRGANASPADGAAATADFLADFGGSVQHPSVSTTGSTADTIRITVSGSVVTLIPGLHWTIHQHAQSPREHWSVGP